jgi:hypothetical protein
VDGTQGYVKLFNQPIDLNEIHLVVAGLHPDAASSLGAPGTRVTFVKQNWTIET